MTINAVCKICEAKDASHLMDVKDHSISKEDFKLVRCSSCGFTWTLDAPSAEDIGPYYVSENYISHSDTKNSATDRLYHLARDYMLSQKKQLVNRSLGTSSGQLLDYGSGTGYFMNHMRESGWDVDGIEVSADARAFTKEKWGIQAQGLDALPKISSEFYDAITLWHVLEHVHDLNETMAHFSRMLKPEGRIFIAVPNCGSGDAKRYNGEWAAYDVPRHLWHFRPDDIDRLSAKQGLVVEKTKGMPLDAFYVSILSEKYRNSSLSLIRGAISGLLSNLSSTTDSKKSSSVIYVIKKISE